MEKNINLLPERFEPKGRYVKVLTTLKKIAGVVAFLVLVVAVILAGVYLVLQTRVTESGKSQEELMAQVRALEETEQRFFLLKDRLGKVKEVLGTESAQEELVIYTEVLEMLPVDSLYDEGVLEREGVSISVTVKDSQDLSQLIDDLIDKGNFKSIEISSLQLNQNGHYKFDLLLTR